MKFWQFKTEIIRIGTRRNVGNENKMHSTEYDKFIIILKSGSELKRWYRTFLRRVECKTIHKFNLFFRCRKTVL